MFYKKTIKKLQEEQEKIWERFKTLQRMYVDDYNRLNNASHKSCENFEKMNEKIEAIIECVNGDRKDINALITLWRNNKKTSGKK